MSLTNNKPVSYVTAEEEDKISRNVLVWLNDFPEIPENIVAQNPLAPIGFEFLKDDVPGMALFTVPGTAISAKYIVGGYRAEYKFKIMYRSKPGLTANTDKRLKADELLNRMGDWCTRGKPDLGAGINVVKVEKDVPAYTGDPNPNGDSDSQIIMKLTYEVI